MYDLEEINPATYELPKKGDMRVPGLIIATEELLNETDIQDPLKQIENVASLPGIVGYSIAMPDMHWGYGFPIGGVAAMDAEEGVISPGGVRYDINCGVRLALAPLPFEKMSEEQKNSLIQSIYSLVPSGVGRGQWKKRGLSDRDYGELASLGSRWSIEQGYGLPEDLDHTESHGCIPGGDLASVSDRAKKRGANQLGTIGSGNHFVEIGSIEAILLPEIAKEWNVTQGLTYILIHSGSRGFGHQVCQDTLNLLIEKGYHKGLADAQLVAAPLNSPEGKQYFSAMAVAANFAFNNRQHILHKVRQSFKEIFSINPEDIPLLYDVCHNIAKFETHFGKRVCVHRKGATRAYGPGAEELAPLFKKTGQPVLVPGDMGRASYLLVGQGNPLTFCSCCHGAGRAHSRVKCLKRWSGKDLIGHMRQQNVIVKASSNRTIAEEMPDAYKDVNVVTKAVEKAGLAKRVARLRPHLVLKG